MKFVKGISLFVVYPLMLLGLGIYVGLEISDPGPDVQEGREESGISSSLGLPLGMQATPRPSEPEASDLVSGVSGTERTAPEKVSEAESETGQGDTGEEEFREVTVSHETLCVDTVYVLEETDILHDTVVETTQRLPDKYVGMNREQFVQAMEVYEAFPPLSEMERGFVSLEVVSFSRERVVVQMNYKFVQPSESFYLAVYNNEVVVYLEDRKTIYIETEIQLDSLPEQLQHDIIQMMWIENEEKLYNFLENYSS